METEAEKPPSESTTTEEPSTSEVKVEEKPEIKEETSFKKPLLIIGPRKGGLIKAVAKKPEEPPPKPKPLIPALQAYSDPLVHKPTKEIPPLPYTEPSWGGEIADEDFGLEVLKSGVILERISLDTKSFYVFGRLSNCDIQMNHPSSSRYHAILQYRGQQGSEEEPRGFYVYDLGSTHGTYLNKQRLKPKVFAPVKVGHVLTIGGSSRLLILQGPPELSEPESELTVTELKEQRRQKEIRDRLEAEQKERDRVAEEERKKQEEEAAGIDWGMGEDADAETDLSENPYASTTNEELYLTDPKKSLRGWFEREGHELNYDVTEKSQGQFLCRVTLPVDDPQGRALVAEALVRGKKKEAVVQCAMEACRLLDRHGLFRQATHEGRGQKKKRDWAEDDYYDSDDDNFLDRTGSVEAKRKKRMAAAGKLESKPDTYQSLVEKLEVLRKEILEAETECQVLTVKQDAPNTSGEDEDALDAFMSSLQADKPNKDKVAQRAAKAKVEKLKQEEARLVRLANIARPASLPPLVVQTAAVAEPSSSVVKKVGALVGARPTAAKSKPHTSVSTASSTVTSETMEEVESEEEEEKVETATTKPAEKEEKPEKTAESSKSVERKLGPSIPPQMLRELRGEVDPEKETKPQRSRVRHRNKATPAATPMEEDDVSEWIPPVGQTGDGRTKLNDKFGY